MKKLIKKLLDEIVILMLLEQLNDYIRVATPSVWLVLAALVLLLIGMLAWGALGTVEAVGADGSAKLVHPIMYVTN